MIDAGTKPKETAILRLVEDMQLNPQIGGCCGQIAVDIQACSGQWFNPVIASQLYEVRKSAKRSATGVTVDMERRSASDIPSFVFGFDSTRFPTSWTSVTKACSDTSVCYLERFQHTGLTRTPVQPLPVTLAFVT